MILIACLILGLVVFCLLCWEVIKFLAIPLLVLIGIGVIKGLLS